jgi:serine/threonine-protein kinase HipA
VHLAVYLGDALVGIIERHEDASLHLRFSEDYREMRGRPTLGQFYVDKLKQPPAGGRHLPPFFANLLPEGPLRGLVARAAYAREDQELRLLAHAGEDLPGAVRVVRVGEFRGDDRPHVQTAGTRLDSERLHFSLAGVQMKLSVVRSDKGFTLPAAGRGGDWIIKAPEAERAGLPENEYTTMAWAWASGIPVPEFAIVAYGRLAGTELRLAPADALCLAIRRFDRVGPGKLHAEDMAQVFGRMPHEKCDRRLNYETLARAVHVLCGVEDLRVFVRRLVFTVLVGNTNAHLKNWALVYPDGRKPRLAPAYDQVATVVMPNVRRALALPFNGSLEFDTVSLGGFQRMAGKLGLDPREVAGWVMEDVAVIMDAWTGGKVPRSSEYRAGVDAHHARLFAAADSLLRG